MIQLIIQHTCNGQWCTYSLVNTHMQYTRLTWRARAAERIFIWGGGGKDKKGHYTGWPKNNGTVDFQDFALINSYIFSPCWIEHHFLVIITPRSLNLVENFLFYEYFLMDFHFLALPLSFSLVGAWGPKQWNSRYFRTLF